MARLNKWIDEHHLISDAQSGFRSGRQTKDQILRLVNDGLSAFNINAKLGAIFIDIEKAFDKVWHDGLLYKLNNSQIPSYLGKWIRNYLENRSFKVRYNSVLSQALPIQTGVPQGSVLGPTLFLLFFNDVLKPKQTAHDPRVGLYADDKTAWVASRSFVTIQRRLQRQLDHVSAWMSKWRTKISTSKTVYSIFNLGNRTLPRLFLTYNGQQIKYEKHPKFLGVTLDPGLRFTKYADEINDRCQRRLNMLRSIRGKKWGASSKLIIRSFKTLIRPIIEYVPMIHRVMCKTSRLKLESIQHRAIRIAMRWPLKTKASVMREQAGLESLEDRSKRLSINYLVKARRTSKLIFDYHEAYKTAFRIKEGSNIKAGYTPRPTIIQRIACCSVNSNLIAI